MKTKKFLLSLLTVIAFVGCSNDDDLMNKGEKGDENDKCGYVAVSIVQTKSNGARANEASASAGFEYGSDEENNVKEGLFFIFDQDGTHMYGKQRIQLSGKNGTGTSPEVERIYDAVLVIDGAKSNPTTNNNVKQIVCVLNAPEGLEEGVEKLNDLTAKIDDYGAHDDGTFILSNSVYQDNATIVLGATIENSKIATSASAARKNPVEVYVERVVAKVRAKTNDFNNAGATPAIDGVDKTLEINVTGIEIANIAEKAYLFKNIEDIKYTWTWNDKLNKRSYWETVPEIGTGADQLSFSNKTYEEIVNESQALVKDGFNIDKLTEFSEYVQPNTNDQQKTAVLVTAQLMDGGSPADLAYIRGGYTTKNGALKEVAKYLANKKNYWKKTADNKLTQLDEGDFEWKDNKDEGILVHGLKSYEVVAQVKSETELFDNDGNKITDGVNQVNKHLQSDEAKSYRAQVFTEGKCYYFVNIEQTAITGQTDIPYEGVVRNHIYDLTLKSIKGIGTPVFDPKDKIIPERVDNSDAFYLGAEIHVLAWKLVAQDINFDFE